MTAGNKVPAIKLFGKTISLSKSDKGCYDHDTILKDISLKKLKKLLSEGEVTKNQNCFSHQISEDLKDHTSSSCTYDNPKSTTLESDQAKEEQSKTTNNSQQQTLKRPDKLIPCPRCNSMDTKFCYYNNYKVNQPRHFCKKCQRYWTNGGTMRNVPVGAGRRKNKHTSFSHLQSAGSNDSVGMHNGAIFNFGSNMQFCESMNLFSSTTDPSGSSDKMGSISTEDRLNNSASQELSGSNFHGLPLQVPFFTSPGFCQPGFPIWASNFSGPWPATNSPNQSLLSSNSSTRTTLGKHSRDESFNLNSSCNSNNKEMLREKNLKGGIWVPKTLRIEDPSEATKSSIWETPGTKNEKTVFMNKGGIIFNNLQSKGGHKENHIVAVMQANPAAMSRSMNFLEAT